MALGSAFLLAQHAAFRLSLMTLLASAAEHSPLKDLVSHIVSCFVDMASD